MLGEPSIRSFTLGAVAALALAAASRADVVTIAASQDNTIYSGSGAESNGAGDYLFAGTTKDATLRRALVRFDVAAALPPGSIITSVSLSLYMSRTRTQDQSVSLHRVNAAWAGRTAAGDVKL